MALIVMPGRRESGGSGGSGGNGGARPDDPNGRDHEALDRLYGGGADGHYHLTREEYESFGEFRDMLNDLADRLGWKDTNGGDVL